MGSREPDAPVLLKCHLEFCWEWLARGDADAWHCVAVACSTLCAAEKGGKRVRMGAAVVVASWCWWYNHRVSCAFLRTDVSPHPGVMARRSRGEDHVMATSMLGLLGSLGGCYGGAVGCSLPPSWRGLLREEQRSAAES